MNNVVQLPAGELHDMLNAVTEVDFDTVSELFTFALDRHLSTQPIANLFIAKPRPRRPSAQRLDWFLAWCSTHKFASSGIEAPPTPAIETTDTNPLREEFFAYVRALGAAVGAGDAYGHSHKYWFFRPGWEVDSALWSEVFGADDPAAVIAFYASASFKADQEQPKRIPVRLTHSDLAVFEWLLDEAAADVCKGRGSKAKELRPVLKAVIATACGLEKVFTFAAKWSSVDFMTGFAQAPASVVQRLLDYWSGRVDFASEMEGPDLQRLALQQANIIGATLLKYLAPSVEAPKAVRRLSFISDGAIVGVRNTIECIEIEVNTDLLKPLLQALSEAIYEAKDTVFGGVFPFTIHAAKDMIGSLARENGRWLADFAYYDAEQYDPDLDYYRLYVDAEWAQPTDGSIRSNRRAFRRFQAYRDALARIEKDGLGDLAGAWWAFFIASQSIAFAGFGIPGSELRSIADLTTPFLTDVRVAKAIEFAKQQEALRPESVAARSSLAMLRRLTLSSGLPSASAGANIIHIGVTAEQVEAFLQDRIGRATWDGLSDQSRRDLTEAEQLWCRTAQDLGAGRSDWGALIALYSRPVEAEARARLGPVIEQLRALGLCTVEELTLGGCVAGFKQAKDAIRKRDIGDLSEALRTRVYDVQAFFSQQGPFVTDVRNRANHGNRERPVAADEFVRWRVAIFRDRLFSVLLGTAADA